MREATYADMEIGNFCFGNSIGEYLVEPREIYENVFCDFLTRNGFDVRGHYADTSDGYENDVFAIRPYYFGDDEEVAELPNFVHKPTGLEISWYKYPMRDSYSNVNISPEELSKVLMHCEASMK